MSVQEWHVVFKDFNDVNYNNFQAMTAGKTRYLTSSSFFSGSVKDWEFTAVTKSCVEGLNLRTDLRTLDFNVKWRDLTAVKPDVFVLWFVQVSLTVCEQQALAGTVVAGVRQPEAEANIS